jgi:hypothetical protein
VPYLAAAVVVNFDHLQKSARGFFSIIEYVNSLPEFIFALSIVDRMILLFLVGLWDFFLF